ncbi:translation initiation factor 2 [uncultured Phascolarctobacterium sp.]|uniref:translation initiation factor 2 n=1 Tax=uncultured Phascolarctobacterium sp. TaxID=512296 RepID=UPI0025F8A6B7|nr:translation initiation factor 2 [uncultured Phascolarctobacterium sp.]
MKGKYSVFVQNNRLRYEFTISRNITIIRGDSATGKTTLLDLLNAYDRDGDSSGVLLKCDVPCVVVGGQRWEENLQFIHNSIVFIDECNRFVKSEDFAICVKGSDNYFVIVTRDDLPNLPYSVKEIYGIRESGKYAGLKQVYNEFYCLYGNVENAELTRENVVIAEDSNAGFDFFSSLCDGSVKCVSANGKSNVFKALQEHRQEKVLVIADGAAFGCEMEKVMQLIKIGRGIALYLPESFEWLILNAGIFYDSELKDILNAPCEYVDSKEFFSWERFFTDLLIKKSHGTYLQYNKRSLNKAYLQDKIKNKIIDAMSPLGF